jgi:hypothetical protein
MYRAGDFSMNREAMETAQRIGEPCLLDELQISIRSRVTVSTEQLSCDLVGEAVILNLRTGVYYGLDSVGARIWTLLQESRLVSELIDMILDEYDVDPDRCEREIIDLLTELKARELIEIEHEGVA